MERVYSPRIEDCVSFLIGKAGQQITRRSRDALAALGITPVQCAVLNVLWETDRQSLAEIGARLVLDSATMTGVADRLEAANLLERGPAPSGDRRVSCLELTASGRSLKVPAQAAMKRVNREVVAELAEKAPDFWRALRQVGQVRPPPDAPERGRGEAVVGSDRPLERPEAGTRSRRRASRRLP